MEKIDHLITTLLEYFAFTKTFSHLYVTNYLQRVKHMSVGGPRSKNRIFRVFRVPFDYPAHSLQETVLPKINVNNLSV